MNTVLIIGAVVVLGAQANHVGVLHGESQLQQHLP